MPMYRTLVETITPTRVGFQPRRGRARCRRGPRRFMGHTVERRHVLRVTRYTHVSSLSGSQTQPWSGQPEQLESIIWNGHLELNCLCSIGDVKNMVVFDVITLYGLLTNLPLLKRPGWDKNQIDLMKYAGLQVLFITTVRGTHKINLVLRVLQPSALRRKSMYIHSYNNRERDLLPV